jgi:hypothetical protein
MGTKKLNSPTHLHKLNQDIDIIINSIDSSSFVISVDQNIKIQELRAKISSKIRIPIEFLRLIHRNKELNDSLLVNQAHISHGDIIYIRLRINGGMISETQNPIFDSCKINTEKEMLLNESSILHTSQFSNNESEDSSTIFEEKPNSKKKKVSINRNTKTPMNIEAYCGNKMYAYHSTKDNEEDGEDFTLRT